MLKKKVIEIENVEIPQKMYEALKDLSIEDQLKHFSLSEKYAEFWGSHPPHDHMTEDDLTRQNDLDPRTCESVDAIAVCKGIVVGVQIKLYDVYLGYSYETSLELFCKNSGTIHSLGGRYGGDYCSWGFVFHQFRFSYTEA